MNRRTSILTGLATAALAATASTASTASAEDAKENPELEGVRALLKAHDEAMKRQDLAGIMATMTEKAAVMGTGPGEIWSGHEEIKTAYEHFFQDFDKGEQDFDYHFKIGGLDGGMGWLMASGDIKGKKNGKAFEFPINISLTVTKSSGKWLIASMHFSTLTSDAGPEGKK
jgi:ketosteroid isomerase-like protein